MSLLLSGFFEMKMKYDESDNAFIRASRAVTDKVTDLIGNVSSLLGKCVSSLLALFLATVRAVVLRVVLTFGTDSGAL